MRGWPVSSTMPRVWIHWACLMPEAKLHDPERR